MNNALTPAELLAECQAIADLLPPHRDKRVGITVANGCTVQPVLLAISPEGIAGPNASFRSFTGETFAEVFGAARAWCPENCTQRRSRLKQKLAAEAAREAARVAAEAAERGRRRSRLKQKLAAEAAREAARAAEAAERGRRRRWRMRRNAGGGAGGARPSQNC